MGKILRDKGELKKAETEWAAEQGAEEVDVVPNFHALQEGKIEIFAEELSEICSVGLPVRAILNINNLSQEKLILAVEVALEVGVNGILTGNGFGPAVTNSEVSNIRKITHDKCSLKAVGGIKTLSHSLELIDAGANLIGTSMGPELMHQLRNSQK